MAIKLPFTVIYYDDADGTAYTKSVNEESPKKAMKSVAKSLAKKSDDHDYWVVGAVPGKVDMHTPGEDDEMRSVEDLE